MKVYIVVSCSSDYNFNIEGIFESYEGALACVEEWEQNIMHSDLDSCVVVKELLQKKKDSEKHIYYVKHFQVDGSWIWEATRVTYYICGLDTNFDDIQTMYVLARNSEEAIEICKKKYAEYRSRGVV